MKTEIVPTDAAARILALEGALYAAMDLAAQWWPEARSLSEEEAEAIGELWRDLVAIRDDQATAA